MRLIDADAFENYVSDEWIKNEISNGDWITFREWLKDQETVIEFSEDITDVVVKGTKYIPQKTGKWISNGVEAFGVTEFWNCSECEYQIRTATRFCPYCGARMECEEE